MNPPRISEKVPLSECAGHPRVTETNERKRMSRPPIFPPPYSVDLVFVIHSVPDAGFLPSRRRSSTSQETGSTKRTKSRLTRIRPVGPRLRIGVRFARIGTDSLAAVARVPGAVVEGEIEAGGRRLFPRVVQRQRDDVSVRPVSLEEG